MKQSNITRTLTLMLLAGATTFVSCSKEEDDLQVGGKTYTMTVNASKGGEKASKQLDLDGTTLTASLGRVVAANGKMYASVESATNAGTTALTVIAQVDHYIGFDECMAIAISDESSKMTWGAAYSACENKTPNIEGATWMLPTVEFWQQMFAANGGNSESYELIILSG